MSTHVQTSWLSRVLSRLPRPLIAVLDNWSSRIAIKHREKRRLAALRPRVARPIQ